MNRVVEIQIYDDSEKIELSTMDIQIMAAAVARAYGYQMPVAWMDDRSGESKFSLMSPNGLANYAKDKDLLEIIFFDVCDDREDLEDENERQVAYTFWFDKDGLSRNSNP